MHTVQSIAGAYDTRQHIPFSAGLCTPQRCYLPLVRALPNTEFHLHLLSPEMQKIGNRPASFSEYAGMLLTYLDTHHISHGTFGGHSYGAAQMVLFAEYVDAIHKGAIPEFADYVSTLEQRLQGGSAKATQTSLYNLAKKAGRVSIDKLFLANPFVHTERNPLHLAYIGYKHIRESIRKKENSLSRYSLDVLRFLYSMVSPLRHFSYTETQLPYPTLIYFGRSDPYFVHQEKGIKQLLDKFPNAYAFDDTTGDHKSGCILTPLKKEVLRTFLLHPSETLDLLLRTFPEFSSRNNAQAQGGAEGKVVIMQTPSSRKKPPREISRQHPARESMPSPAIGY